MGQGDVEQGDIVEGITDLFLELFQNFLTGGIGQLIALKGLRALVMDDCFLFQSDNLDTVSLLAELSEGDCCIGTAKSKTVGKPHPDLSLPGCIGSIIQIAVRVGIFIIDRGRDN